VVLLLLQVRLLCRRQFLARALGLKVAQAQRQQQRVSGGSATQQQGQQLQQQQQSSPYTLTHGDMWTH
jgi:protein involved in polysaccharide export with SLBB domain